MFGPFPSWGAGQAEEGRVLADVTQKNHEDEKRNWQAQHARSMQRLLKIPGGENWGWKDQEVQRNLRLCG